MAEIDRLLEKLAEGGGSDLHLAAGLEPRVRCHGCIRPLDSEPSLSDPSLRVLLREIASPAGWSEFETTGDLDFAYGLEGVARFRANYFVQRNGAGAVFRLIPEEIISTGKVEIAGCRRFVGRSG